MYALGLEAGVRLVDACNVEEAKLFGALKAVEVEKCSDEDDGRTYPTTHPALLARVAVDERVKLQLGHSRDGVPEAELQEKGGRHVQCSSRDGGVDVEVLKERHVLEETGGRPCCASRI